jgi:hypothetical protein
MRPSASRSITAAAAATTTGTNVIVLGCKKKFPKREISFIWQPQIKVIWLWFNQTDME